MDAEKQNSRTVTEAQVFSRQWTPPTGVLGRIMLETAARIEALNSVERRAIERRVRDAGEEVRRAGAEGREADAGI